MKWLGKKNKQKQPAQLCDHNPTPEFWEKVSERVKFWKKQQINIDIRTDFEKMCDAIDYLEANKQYEEYYVKMVESLNVVRDYLQKFEFWCAYNKKNRNRIGITYNNNVDINFAFGERQIHIEFVEKTTNSKFCLYIDHEISSDNINGIKIIPRNYGDNKFRPNEPVTAFFIKVDNNLQFSAEIIAKDQLVFESDEIDEITCSKTMQIICQMLNNSDVLILKINEQYPQIAEFYENDEREKLLEQVIGDTRKKHNSIKFLKAIEKIKENV